MRHLVALLVACISGCVTLSGDYRVSATRADGTPLKPVIIAQGSAIYSARNAICSAYPGATVTIVDLATEQEYSAESPYHCR